MSLHESAFALFEDWCFATSQSSVPTTWAAVQQFRLDIPCSDFTWDRRLAAIRAGQIAAGTTLAMPTSARRQRSLEAQRKILAELPLFGWTAGLIGRRDGFLTVVAANLTRASIDRLEPQEIEQVGRTILIRGVAVATANLPGTCPACAISRWLRVLGHAQRDGWQSVKIFLSEHPDATAAEMSGHDCEDIIVGSWTDLALLPAIDQYGSVEDHVSLSPRAMAAILGRRLSPTAPPTVPISQMPTSMTGTEILNRKSVLDELLDRLTDDADAAHANAEAATKSAGVPRQGNAARMSMPMRRLSLITGPGRSDPYDEPF